MRIIAKRSGRCYSCDAAFAAGAIIRWDADDRVARCGRCNPVRRRAHEARLVGEFVAFARRECEQRGAVWSAVVQELTANEIRRRLGFSMPVVAQHHDRARDRARSISAEARRRESYRSAGLPDPNQRV